jgi:hypothetical protein
MPDTQLVMCSELLLRHDLAYQDPSKTDRKLESPDLSEVRCPALAEEHSYFFPGASRKQSHICLIIRSELQFVHDLSSQSEGQMKGYAVAFSGMMVGDST